MNEPIELVLFDAVGTLIFPDPPVAIAYERIGSQFGSELTADRVSERFRAAFRQSYDPRNPGKPLQTSEARELSRWRAIVGAVFFDAPTDAKADLFNALWQHFAEPENWRLFADVQPAIEGLLERGYRVGIASNFDERLIRICQDSTVLQRLEPIFISSQVGWSKPATEYYRHIERATNLAPQQILIIGDDEQNDVRAPQKLGWQAQWLVRGESPAAPNQISSLLELVKT